jgi:cellobiose transport system substrate-binding protein
MPHDAIGVTPERRRRRPTDEGVIVPRSTRKTWMAVAGATSIALFATACGSSGGSSDDSSSSGDEKITLTISTFNEWGYDDLLDEYMELNPNITIEHNKFAKSDDAKEQFQTALGAGSGLADVVGVEVDWMPQIIQYSDQFVDLSSDSVDGRWNNWTIDQATSADGALLGYPTDIGPEAIAYRADLFEAAGLPSDPEAVAALFGGDSATWDDFFSVGDQFIAAGTGVPFYDSADAIAQGMINQQEYPLEDADGTIIATTNPDIRNMYDTILSHTDQSAHLKQWEEDWVNAFQTDGFAVMLAPSWMLGVISGNAEGVEGWDIANVFPGGGGNWGGSFLTVPTMSEHPEEAKALADWLTAPEQQLKAFATTGNFPSQVEAQKSDELQTITNEFFNDAPIGQIFTDRAAAISVIPFKGENYFTIRTGLSDAINRVDVDKSQSADESWKGFEDAVAAIG